MNTPSLYREQNTFFHKRMDPLSKLLLVCCLFIDAFVVPTLPGACLLALLTVGLLYLARELGRAVKILAGCALLLISIFLIQGLFYQNNQTVLLQVGPLSFYREGISYALKISLRVITMIAAGSLLVLTTSPTDLLEACVRRGVSPRLAYMLAAILQIIPLMMRNAAKIQEAQEARGMAVRGSLSTRFRAFLPLLTPLILSSFVNIQERSMALEVRGFSLGGPRTFYRSEPVYKGMLPVRFVLIGSTLGILCWRLFG
ncbi:energy-coupling factor transporter transmembrane component T family protein [Brevibacillus fulvus]|uniref:Energy-coupling factor transport system permease protein n=1 Tax=Brevibacillus fulvus TaxID=1125967 RepID=A0A939BS29_9BACL|nr:energy-coupling factor transporter transmembrane component T [Brevibacillus fulvus]MBM7590043.1 energy-coupling factor transport system permease protein [Brevibacillus fulvus]